MNTKNWLFKNLLIIILLFVGVGGFNLFIDPLWLFNHSNFLNKIIFEPDERRVRINKVKQGQGDYDSVLFGTSRSTYINQHNFKPWNLFNFSFSNFSTDELDTAIEFLESQPNFKLQNIVVGFDFKQKLTNDVVGPLGRYIKESESLDQVLKQLFSFKTLLKSFDSAFDSLFSKMNEGYNRDNVRLDPNFTLEHKQWRLNLGLKLGQYDQKAFDHNFKTKIRSFKDRSKRYKLYVFTSPVSEKRFLEMIRIRRYADYEMWLRDLVSVFGEINHFMYLNSVNLDFDSHFIDSHHFRPLVGDWIISMLTGKSVETAKPRPKDFGVRLNAANIDFQLAKMRRKLLERYPNILLY